MKSSMILLINAVLSIAVLYFGAHWECYCWIAILLAIIQCVINLFAQIMSEKKLRDHEKRITEQSAQSQSYDDAFQVKRGGNNEIKKLTIDCGKY